MDPSSSRFANSCPVCSAGNNSLVLRSRSFPRNGFRGAGPWGDYPFVGCTRYAKVLLDICQTILTCQPQSPGEIGECVLSPSDQRSQCGLAPANCEATTEVFLWEIDWRRRLAPARYRAWSVGLGRWPPVSTYPTLEVGCNLWRLRFRGLLLSGPDVFQEVVALDLPAREEAVDCILVFLEYLEDRGQPRSH